MQLVGFHAANRLLKCYGDVATIVVCVSVCLSIAKQHLMAVGDAAGTLHILAIPWSLRQPTPNEVYHIFFILLS